MSAFGWTSSRTTGSSTLLHLPLDERTLADTFILVEFDVRVRVTLNRLALTIRIGNSFSAFAAIT